MRTRVHATVRLGDLVAAAFDSAEDEGRDPAEVLRLATAAVRFVLRRVRRRKVPLIDMTALAMAGESDGVEPALSRPGLRHCDAL
jgi:hypothetical protein